MPHRYFTTEIADGTAVLRGTDAHHLARVMRARMGDTVILCDGSAVEYTATITGFGDDCVEFSVEPGYPSAAEPSVEVTLLAGYPKQDKLEQIIQHGVELGAAHVVPFFSRYCVAAPKKEEQKNERYNRIALEAAKQCGRGVLPDVALPLPNFGAVCRTFDQYDLVLFCYECGGAPVRQLLAETPARRRPKAEDRHRDRSRGRLCRRGSRNGRQSRSQDRGPWPPHPAVRDRPAGRARRRDDPDRQSGITGAPGGAPSTKETFRPTGSGKSAGFPGPIFYFLPRIKISRIFVQVCPVILSQISGLFCARSTKLPTPPPKIQHFVLTFSAAQYYTCATKRRRA